MIAPPEPSLTEAQMIARAVELRPTLLQRQDETEKLTHYPEETHRDFLKAGFYRTLVPRRFGGYEFGLPTFYRVVTETARGCPSTGWSLSLGAAHALQAASLYEADVQAELFGDGDFRAASTVAPVGVAEPDGDGHVVLDGTWDYCSGSPWATHLLAHTFAPPAREGGARGPMMLFAAPRSTWTVVDNWQGVLGMRGSGSNSIRFDRARIPSSHLIAADLMNFAVDGGTPGARLHGNPMYAGRTVSFFQGELASIMVGTAYAAVDEYARIIADRPLLRDSARTRADLSLYQRHLGSALAGVDTAFAAVQHTAQEWMECARRNVAGEAPFTVAVDDRLSGVFVRAGRIAWESMNDIVRTAGSRYMRDGARIQRYVRDALVAWTHVAPTMQEPLEERVGRARVGVPFDDVPLLS